MRKTDPDGLDPRLRAQLRSELDRLEPPSTLPRYAAAKAPALAWRLAPAVLAVAFVGILALTAFAATGSANPVVWTQRVQTVINPPPPTPDVEESPAPSPSHVTQPVPPARHPTPPPTARPEPSEGTQPPHSPEPSESPEPGDH